MTLTQRQTESAINNKYLRNKILRNIRFGDSVHPTDPRLFLRERDYVLEKIVKENNLKASLYHDETIKRCMGWIQDNVEYERDYIGEEVKNNWQVPSVTSSRGKGDCEDLSILLISLAMCAKVPYYKLKLVSGTVQKNPTAKTGGHAWVLYFNKDREWELIESTSKTDANKGLAKDLLGQSWYKSINWTCNKKYTFAQKEIKPDDSGY